MQSCKDEIEMEKMFGLLSTTANVGNETTETATIKLAEEKKGVGRSSSSKTVIDTTKSLNLRLADGKELHPCTDSEDDDDGPSRYMTELLDVCDIRYKLGEYELAGANYFRCCNMPWVGMNIIFHLNLEEQVFSIGHKYWVEGGNESWIFALEMKAKDVLKNKA